MLRNRRGDAGNARIILSHADWDLLAAFLKSRFGAVFGSYLFRVPAEGKTSPHGAKILSERPPKANGRASEGVRSLSLRRVIVT